MIYFMLVGAVCAILGLAAIAGAVEFGLALFGYALFGFGVFLALFLLKRHFDLADGSGRP